MYVLMITFRETVNPTDARFEYRSLLYENPVAVSSDFEELRRLAKNIRERFPDKYYSHEIIEVMEV